MRTKNNVVEQTSVPLDGIFTKDFASFLVNHSNTIFSTDKKTDETIARAVADGNTEIPRNDPGLSRLDLEESDAVNLPKISYVKETWNSIVDSEKFALIKEYTEFLMAFRESETAVGFPVTENGQQTYFPENFAIFLKEKTGIKNSIEEEKLSELWSGFNEEKKNNLIKEYCAKGNKECDEIATSYNGHRSIEGITRAKKAMSNAIEGVGVIQDTEPSSFSDWIPPSPSSIAKTVFPFITASLFGAAAAAAEPNSNSASAARQPTRTPTRQPSEQPLGTPTGQPLGTPTGQPSEQPLGTPTGQPSGKPTGQPSGKPTSTPTGKPSGKPTETPKPTLIPSTDPTVSPSMLPSLSRPRPSISPSAYPTVRAPRFTGQPTSPSGQPTGIPTESPSFKVYHPIFGKPTRKPTGQPTGQPLWTPTGQPTGQPLWTPTGQPSRQPSTYLRAQNPSNSKDAGLSSGHVAGIALAGLVTVGAVIYCINRSTRPSSKTNTRGNHTQLANNDNDRGERL